VTESDSLTASSVTKAVVAWFVAPWPLTRWLTLVTGLVLLTAWWLAGDWYARQLVAQKRADVAIQLNSRAAALQTALGERFALLDGMVALVESHPSLAAMDAAFEPFAASLLATNRSSSIRNFALFPDGVQRYEYPVSNNSVPDAYRNLYTHPVAENRENAQRALITQRVVLGQPRQLGQGGLGLVATQAVFPQGHLWGFVTMALDIPPMLNEAGLVADDEHGNLRMTLADSTGHVFFGSQPFVSEDQLAMLVVLPDGTWTLYAAPADGWDGATLGNLRLFQGTTLPAAMLLMLLTWLMLSRHQRLILEAQRLERLESAERAALAQAELARDNAERARVGAEHSATRSRTLQAITAALAPALDPRQIAHVVFERALPAVRARSAALVIRSPDGDFLEQLAESGYSESVAAAYQRYAVSASVPAAEVVRTGKPLWIGSSAAVAPSYPYFAARPTGQPAVAILPLSDGDTTRGALILGFGEERELDADDRTFLLTVAGQCAVALQRADLHAAEQTARRQAEEALGARDVFLRTLAHDLKTPMVSLAWHAQVLLRRALDGRLDTPVLTEGLDLLVTQTNEAMAAVDELHDLTRAGAPVQLDVAHLDLSDVVKQAIAGLSPTAASQVRVEASEADLMVDADRARLIRVLRNLLDNASKYSPVGGAIVVSLGRVRSDDAADWAEVRVQDNGIGIPTADLPHVFERYHRGSNVQRIGGEGLGLASVRNLVDLHGGQVSIESQEGIGSTVTVRLPLAAVAHSSAAADGLYLAT
jgi:signal transduction histidine kinase/sensor domain CHASE-containing protein